MSMLQRERTRQRLHLLVSFADKRSDPHKEGV